MKPFVVKVIQANRVLYIETDNPEELIEQYKSSSLRFEIFELQYKVRKSINWVKE